MNHQERILRENPSWEISRGRGPHCNNESRYSRGNNYPTVLFIERAGNNGKCHTEDQQVENRKLSDWSFGDYLVPLVKAWFLKCRVGQFFYYLLWHNKLPYNLVA